MNREIHAAAGHAAHDEAHNEAHAEPHGSLGGYLVGFGLSVILTAIPFGLVMAGGLSKAATALAIAALAAVQIVVHAIFFLHMSPRSEAGWTLMAALFTLVLVAITLPGSLWVMYHLNTNMMMSAPGMAEMP